MLIPQSKRKLIAATALFVSIGALTGAIATGGAATISFAQTTEQQDGGGAATGQQGRIIQQGTVSSSEIPLPGFEGQQRATILPLSEEGTIYSGVLTYTASEPVNVVVLHVQNLNETERGILNDTEDGEFGPLVTAALDNQTSLALTIITPTYGDSPAPSASIPFAGNAVWLHTAEAPFAATYALSAQTQQAEMMNNISNVTLTVTAEDEEAAADEDEEAAADEDEEAAADEDEEAAADADAGNTTATNGDVDEA